MRGAVPKGDAIADVGLCRTFAGIEEPGSAFRMRGNAADKLIGPRDRHHYAVDLAFVGPAPLSDGEEEEGDKDDAAENGHHSRELEGESRPGLPDRGVGHRNLHERHVVRGTERVGEERLTLAFSGERSESVATPG
jgi:hypothetical protein